MKSSADQVKWPGLLGLLLLGWGLWRLAIHQASPSEIEAALRLGYARSAAKLAQAGLAGGQGGWLKSFERALGVQLAAADRLKVEPPLEDELVMLETDVMPAASYRLEFASGGLWSLQVRPWRGKSWQAPSHSGGAVRPAAYPANGRVAYYDLGRIWIADLQGLRMQSLKHVPLLEKGGALMWDYAGTRLCWMGDFAPEAAAVELGAMKEGEQ